VRRRHGNRRDFTFQPGDKRVAHAEAHVDTRGEKPRRQGLSHFARPKNSY
jgi:hypothetical protein